MITADLLRAVLVCSVPSIRENVIWLYVLVALNSTLTQFYEPARESALPEIAGEEELVAATSLTEISSFGSTAVGFLATGLFAASGNLDWAFYLDGLTYLFSALCTLPVVIPQHEEQEATSVGAVAKNLTVGLGHIRKTESLFALPGLFRGIRPAWPVECHAAALIAAPWAPANSSTVCSAAGAIGLPWQPGAGAAANRLREGSGLRSVSRGWRSPACSFRSQR
jgi:hypothetical protein